VRLVKIRIERVMNERRHTTQEKSLKEFESMGFPDDETISSSSASCLILYRKSLHIDILLFLAPLGLWDNARKKAPLLSALTPQVSYCTTYGQREPSIRTGYAPFP